MLINCGFELKVNKNHYKFKNVQDIKIPDGLTPQEIRKELQKYAPDDKGWNITGYFIVEEVSNVN